jgi:hypothetical protein
VDSTDQSFEHSGSGTWVRTLLLPALAFMVAVAIVGALVYSGAVQGSKTYPEPPAAPTTQPTVLIEQ